MLQQQDYLLRIDQDILPAIGPGHYRVLVYAAGTTYTHFAPPEEILVGNMGLQADVTPVQRENAIDGIAWGVGTVVACMLAVGTFKAVKYYKNKKQPAGEPAVEKEDPHPEIQNPITVYEMPIQSALARKIVQRSSQNLTLHPAKEGGEDVTVPRMFFNPLQASRPSPTLKGLAGPSEYYNTVSSLSIKPGKRVQKVTIQKHQEE